MAKKAKRATKPKNAKKSKVSKSKGKPKKEKFCTQVGCKKKAATKGFCRLHYIANWKTLRFSKQIKAEERLNHYVEKLVKKYPKDYLDRIKEGLESEDKFKETVEELNFDSEANENQTEEEFLEKFARDLKISNE